MGMSIDETKFYPGAKFRVLYLKGHPCTNVGIRMQ